MEKILQQPTYPPDLPARDNAEWIAAADAVFTNNYGARRLAIVRGAGTRVWDADGNEYWTF